MTSASRSRDLLRQIASQTVAIVQDGSYRTASGAMVDITALVSAALAGTRVYLPGEHLQPVGHTNTAPAIEVTNESTLDAARRLGGDVAALVFASARNPGGGFLSGAQAQEESIARASALYACLQQVPDFYAEHRHDSDLRYSDRIIYSPNVPVFRDDSGQLLDQPHHATFLTAAAPNLGAIRDSQPDNADTVPEVLRRRAIRVLDLAAAHGHRRLVLGAWGCGVFRNDPAVVAGAFATALHDNPHFDQVLFAVLDHTPQADTYRAFADVFAPAR